MNETNLRAVEDRLIRTDWSDLYFGDLNTAYCRFMTVLMSVINSLMPIKTKSVRNKDIRREPWYRAGLQNSRRRLDKLHHEAIKKGKTSSAYSNYITFRYVYNSLIRAARKKHYDDLFNEVRNDSKQTWAIINQINASRKTDKQPIKRLVANGRVISDMHEITNCLAEYFASDG